MLPKWHCKNNSRRSINIGNFWMNSVSSTNTKTSNLLWCKKCGRCKLVTSLQMVIQTFKSRRKLSHIDLTKRKTNSQLHLLSMRPSSRKSSLLSHWRKFPTSWRTPSIWKIWLKMPKIKFNSLMSVRKRSHNKRVNGRSWMNLKRALSLFMICLILVSK